MQAPNGFPRIMLALFFTVFPLGVGLVLLFYLWFGSFGEFGAPPPFFRAMGSLIGLAFVAFGAMLVYGSLKVRGSSLMADVARLTHDLPKGVEGQAVYDCPRCGAPLAGSADVSPSGDAKCHHCGSWFNVRAK
jgi:DNA-directed RNA polymerase subunit RPC12/RpoP